MDGHRTFQDQIISIVSDYLIKYTQWMEQNHLLAAPVDHEGLAAEFTVVTCRTPA
jgi:hypothetical protein